MFGTPGRDYMVGDIFRPAQDGGTLEFRVERVRGGITRLQESYIPTNLPDGSFFFVPLESISSAGFGGYIDIEIRGGAVLFPNFPIYNLYDAMGYNYRRDDRVRILGSLIGGTDGVDDIDLTVAEVAGEVVEFSYWHGNAPTIFPYNGNNALGGLGSGLTFDFFFESRWLSSEFNGGQSRQRISPGRYGPDFHPLGWAV